MNLASTTLWTAIATALRIGAGLIVAKVVALVGGPSGLGLLGQFQNFVQIITGLSGSLFQGGIVKYTAEYREQPVQLVRYVGTAVRVAVIFSSIATVLIILLHRYFARWIMHDDTHSQLFILTGAMVSLLVANGIAMGLLNGLGRIKTYLIITGLGSVVFMLITLLLTYLMGVQGALFASVISPAAVAGVSMVVLYPYWATIRAGWQSGIDHEQLAKMGKFALMSLAGILALPLALLGIRTELVHQLGWEAAGYWQAVWQISNACLAVFTTGLSVYYLPKLSGMHNVDEIRKELTHYFQLVLPLAIIFSVSVYFLRDFILQMLYSDKFLLASDLFAWQLCADVIRVATWGYGFLQLAKAMTSVFILRELSFGVLYYFGTLAMIPYWGLLATVKVFVMLCLLNGIFVFWFVRRHLKRQRSIENLEFEALV